MRDIAYLYSFIITALEGPSCQSIAYIRTYIWFAVVILTLDANIAMDVIIERQKGITKNNDTNGICEDKSSIKRLVLVLNKAS